MSRRAWKRAVCVAALSAGCGARTGLRVWDFADAADVPSIDRVDATDATDVPDVRDAADVVDIPRCMTRNIGLVPPTADLLLLIDRSTSMSQDLAGGNTGVSKWSLLSAAVSATIPRYETSLAMGLVFFPGLGSAGLCTVSASPDVTPALGRATAIERAFAAAMPEGRTPTYEGLRAAGNFLAAVMPAPGYRAIVLATDGAPNCNGTLNGRTCSCTALNNAGQQPCIDDPALCLDDTRTITEVQTLASRGIPTFVVGLDGDGNAQLIDVLTRLAIAGGRPNPAGTRRYYSIRVASDLPGALDQIQRQITRCVYEVPAFVPAAAMVSLTLGTAVVPEDPRHGDGWDWTDARRASVTFYGAACDRAAASTAPVSLAIACPPDT